MWIAFLLVLKCNINIIFTILNMAITAIIVDDEDLAVKRLENLLGDISNVELLASCTNGIDAIEKIKSLKPDLLFLDIQLKDMSGFEILERLPNKNLPIIIFITAFNDYALKAFDVFAFDYLLKPFKDDRFYKSVNKAIDQLNSSSGNVFNENLKEMLNFISDSISSSKKTSRNLLPIKLGNKTHFIKSNNIKYILASGYYAEIHTTEKKHLLRESLSNLNIELDETNFIRIHRSTIINTSYIKELINSSFSEIDVKMIDNTVFRISKSYKKNFLKTMRL